LIGAEAQQRAYAASLLQVGIAINEFHLGGIAQGQVNQGI
jgi:hypothetical protein